MVAYVSHIAKRNDVAGNSLIDVVAPPAGTGYLLVALRAKFKMVENAPSGDPKLLQLRWTANDLENFFPIQLPMPVSTDHQLVDLMGYLSNLSQVGFSNPSKLEVNVSNPMIAGESVVLFGYSIVGPEA